MTEETTETTEQVVHQAEVIDPAEYLALKESVVNLEANNQKLLKQKSDAKKAADQAILDAARSSGDVESITKSYEDKFSALELSWSEKYKALEASSGASSTEFNGIINELTVNSTARSIAAEISKPGFSEVFMPHLQSRLSVEIKNGKPITRVMDKAGKLSAMTIDELKGEFHNNPAFAELVVGTMASGGGSSEGNGKGKSNELTRDDFSKLTPVEQSTFIVKDGGKLID